ncbi:MAG: ABC transporter ATP-binding protein [Chloroflexi bacterium]|nr:ABC transporter ATP-binding protein [Chloroflexota bacterium]
MFHGGWWSLIRADESKGKAKIDRKLLLRILAYAKPYWGNIAIVLIAIVVISLIELIPPLLYRTLIDIVIPNKDFRQLTVLALAMIGIPITSGLIGIVERYFSAKAGEGIIFDLRQEMYDHLQRMSLRFFTHTRSGEIVSRFNSDVVGAQNAITGTIPSIVTNLVTLISTLVVMITIDARLTLLSIAVLPLFLLPTRRVARILRDIRRKAMEYNADLSSLITETLGINGALLVKTFGRQRQESEHFRDINENVRDIGVRRALVGRWFFMGLGISGAIGTALIYWAGGYLVMTDVLTIGTIVAFAAYLTRLYGPISSLTNVQVDFATSMVSFERVFEYLDLPIEIQDKPGAIELSKVDGLVSFDNVSFSYLSDEDEQPEDDNGRQPSYADEDKTNTVVPDITLRWALKDVSFEISPGKLVALVGHSGAGKTTITYLLPRLYDSTGGKISLDGYDIRDITQESLADQIGMVTQETYLFHDTVRANLLYARPEADQEEISAACKAAHIHDFIQGLPDGYNTVVGERGYRLSGGEKQRLAIARVILKNPRILILDEATSHLDSHNEALIQAALAPLMAGRTSLVIAHRLSTILAADKILVLDRGQLIEQGTHSTLLDQEGLYAELYETQFKGENLEIS